MEQALPLADLFHVTWNVRIEHERVGDLLLLRSTGQVVSSKRDGEHEQERCGQGVGGVDVVAPAPWHRNEQEKFELARFVRSQDRTQAAQQSEELLVTLFEPQLAAKQRVRQIRETGILAGWITVVSEQHHLLQRVVSVASARTVVQTAPIDFRRFRVSRLPSVVLDDNSVIGNQQMNVEQTVRGAADVSAAGVGRRTVAFGSDDGKQDSTAVSENAREKRWQPAAPETR